MALDEGDIDRIAAIHQQLIELADELQRLEAKADDLDDPDDRQGRRRLTLIRGGLAATAEVVGSAAALMRSHPRRAIVSAATIVAAAMAAVIMPIPGHHETIGETALHTGTSVTLPPARTSSRHSGPTSGLPTLPIPPARGISADRAASVPVGVAISAVLVRIAPRHLPRAITLEAQPRGEGHHEAHSGGMRRRRHRGGFEGVDGRGNSK